MSDFDEFWEERITYEQKNLIESLLNDVKLEDRFLDQITLFLHQNPSKVEAEQLIYHLETLKPDHINGGFNYSQTDILKKLKNDI